MPRNCLTIFLFTLLIVSCLGCNERSPVNKEEPIELKFGLHTDSSYSYIVDSKLVLQPEVKGQTLHITQNIKLISTFSILNTNRFGKNVEVNYDRIIMTSDNGMAKNVYDTDDTTNRDPLFSAIGTLINDPYKLLVKDNGTVMTSADPTGEAGRLGDTSIRKMMLQCLYVYPSKPVKPGDTWQKSYNTSTGFLHMHVINTFVLTRIENNIAHIDINGTITPEDSLQDMAFKGVQTGTMDMDTRTGIIINSKLSQQLSGRINTGTAKNEVNATGEINISYARK